MSKYSFDFKKQIVKEYLKGKEGYGYLAKKYNIPHHDQVRKWIKTYQNLGDIGLMESQKNKKYSFNFKMNAVKLYLTTKISYSELAIVLKIKHSSLIAIWVKDYKAAGPDALKPKNRGRIKEMNKKENKSLPKNKKNDINLKDEKLKQLEEENLKLRIENAYLKELRRMREEEEISLKKKQE